MEKESILPKNIRQIGEIHEKIKICMEDYVMTYIRKKEPEEKEGYLGILLGEKKMEGKETYVFVRGILEVPDQESNDAEKILRRERSIYFPDWDVVGCFVLGTYPTRQLEQLSVKLPEADTLIYHLQEQEETLYWKENNQCEKIGGYFIFYEQNRKMQDYLADTFPESSVEKESEPDHAIKNFREKVKEKSELRRGSFLRLASSFFVVTLLLIGVMVINRLDRLQDMAVVANIEQETDEYYPSAAVSAGSDLMETQTESEMTEETEVETEEEAAAWAEGRQIRASYIIKEGDTLANICKKYYGDLDSLDKICEANGITDANMILPGEKIVLP